jgi:asparagine synthase (glutamine-hydrolysing)
MCGIAGIRRFDGGTVDPGLLLAMSATIAHRGPDDSGIWTAGSVGFAHRRLSIIDVEGSPQPMTSPVQPVTICFNGEILNYRSLRSGLTFPFRTDGDTETLLALYARDGISLVDHLRGQFAFALYDDASEELVLVRDRLGILPLYYYRTEQFLAFASEIKALAPVISNGLQLEEASLWHYLAHRSVPAPDTLFAGVRKLIPGSLVVISKTGDLTERRYWRISTRSQSREGPAGAVDRLDDALRSAVDEAQVADVPVGAYLSGGVDSSLIVALVALTRQGDVDTFSAGFGDARVDEVAEAQFVARTLGTRHHEVTVQPNDFADLWQTLTWHRDAPLSEPADVAVYRLAQLAGERVKVVLSGEGSDELFGGYPKYRFARLSQAVGFVPSRLRGGSSALIDRWLPVGAHRPRVAVRALGAPDADERLRAWFAPFTAAERLELVGSRPSSARPALEDVWRSGDPLRRMLAHDVSVWLPDNLLERGDRMSMAASVELRPPFLDHRVVELAFSLPSSVKVHGRTSKWVVKEVARRYLPDAIVDRPKVGFKVPLDRWFREGLRDTVRSLLLDNDAFVPDLLDRRAVNRLVTAHESGERNEDIRIWTLMGLEVWARTFLAGTTSAAIGVR